MSRTADESRRSAAALMDRIGRLAERIMGRLMMMGEMRELWALTGDALRFTEWANRERFPELQPLTCDDSPEVGRIVMLRAELLNRMYRLWRRETRRRKRRRRK